jgi:hypothetical protein
MPPSPSERALKTRLFPEGLVKRVTRLTLSARNTYTGERGIRKFQGLMYRRVVAIGQQGGPHRHIPRGEGYRKAGESRRGYHHARSASLKDVCRHVSSCRTRTLPKICSQLKPKKSARPSRSRGRP